MVPVPTMFNSPPPDSDFIPGGAAVPILGEMIPIVAIVLGIGIVMLRLYLDFRRRRELYQLYHAERMAAIEKGIELPPLPTDFFRDTRVREPRRVRSRRSGLILLFLGAAICIALWGSGGDERSSWLWGLVPTGLGLALLLSSALESREQERKPTGSEVGHDSGFPDPPST